MLHLNVKPAHVKRSLSFRKLRVQSVEQLPLPQPKVGRREGSVSHSRGPKSGHTSQKVESRFRNSHRETGKRSRCACAPMVNDPLYSYHDSYGRRKILQFQG